MYFFLTVFIYFFIAEIKEKKRINMTVSFENSMRLVSSNRGEIASKSR